MVTKTLSCAQSILDLWLCDELIGTFLFNRLFMDVKYVVIHNVFNMSINTVALYLFWCYVIKSVSINVAYLDARDEDEVSLSYLWGHLFSFKWEWVWKMYDFYFKWESKMFAWIPFYKTFTMVCITYSSFLEWGDDYFEIVVIPK